MSGFDHNINPALEVRSDEPMDISDDDDETIERPSTSTRKVPKTSLLPVTNGHEHVDPNQSTARNTSASGVSHTQPYPHPDDIPLPHNYAPSATPPQYLNPNWTYSTQPAPGWYPGFFPQGGYQSHGMFLPKKEFKKALSAIHLTNLEEAVKQSKWQTIQLEKHKRALDLKAQHRLWGSAVDTNGKRYYFNASSGQSQRVPPTLKQGYLEEDLEFQLLQEQAEKDAFFLRDQKKKAFKVRIEETIKQQLLQKIGEKFNEVKMMEMVLKYSTRLYCQIRKINGPRFNFVWDEKAIEPMVTTEVKSLIAEGLDTKLWAKGSK